MPAAINPTLVALPQHPLLQRGHSYWSSVGHTASPRCRWLSLSGTPIMELCHPQPHPRRPISNPLQVLLAYTQPIFMLHRARIYYGLTTGDSFLHTLHPDAASGVALAYAYPQRHVRDFRIVYETESNAAESSLPSSETFQVENLPFRYRRWSLHLAVTIAGCRRIYCTFVYYSEALPPLIRHTTDCSAYRTGQLGSLASYGLSALHVVPVQQH